ncbi:C2H2-type zinc finger protein KABA2_12S01122 [Maudiozyma barnettii]|uniref:C2H2-type domain-containing protein n=1 Tax=Maudiozyma barnettii TaxID=61262 RepID=A0A8H2VK34_9SACH|nr:uncharacterized protein KABA2_12S01122 [Kazachstania barnettii]CAB4256872.1 some similarities with Saccharomyces cerevisiae YPR015C Putative protein of unknown function [Kazachstania barnettii]
MDHGRSIVNSKSYESIHSMHSARRELNNNLFSTSTPSSLPSIGRTNSVFVNPVRNDENYYYPITKIQLPPAGDANEGYYIKAVGYQPSHDFGYNSMSGTRYNSIDSNSSDFEIGNRLRQLGKIQEPQEDPRQQYINVPYRVGDMATQSSYPSSYPGGKYQRSTTNGYISGPTASVYRPNSNISIPVPHMYPEAVTNNSNTGPAYDKIIRSINNEYTPNNSQYPQPIYQFNPTITNPQQQQQQQQQQQLVQYPVQEHYHYQLGTDNQDVPHYGKIPSHFHKKKINQCNICGKILTRPSSLHSHMFVHTGDRPYICKWPNCGKTFNVKSNMNRHYKLHLKRQVIDDKLGIKRNEGDKLITENKPYILSHNEVGR